MLNDFGSNVSGLSPCFWVMHFRWKMIRHRKSKGARDCAGREIRREIEVCVCVLHIAMYFANSIHSHRFVRISSRTLIIYRMLSLKIIIFVPKNFSVLRCWNVNKNIEIENEREREREMNSWWKIVWFSGDFCFLLSRIWTNAMERGEKTRWQRAKRAHK